MRDLIDRQAVLELPKNVTRTLFGDVVEESIDVELIKALPSAETFEDCDTCKYGRFGSSQCDNCRMRYTSHYERSR